MSLDKIYEAKHIEAIQSGYNRMARLLRINANELAKRISVLQSKQLLEPTKFAKQIARNKRLLDSVSKNFFELEQNLNSELNGLTKKQWGLANTKNSLLAKAYIGEVKGSYANLNLNTLEAFQKRFQGGKQLSDRIHDLTKINKQLYEDYIASGITQGRSSISIARDLNEINLNPYNVKVFDKDGNPTTLKKISSVLQPNSKGRGVYKSPLKNLFRVTRTETNAAYRTSDRIRFNQFDFVVGYEVHLSPSHNLLDVCDFNKGKYPKTFVFTGWHSNCFCYVTSILKTKEEFRNELESKHEVKSIPRSAQRYQKTNKKQYWDWQKENFNASGEPLKLVGGASKGIEPYKISTDPKDYVPKSKILKRVAKL